MELKDTPEGTAIGLDELSLRRAEWTHKTHHSRTAVFKGCERPGNPASAAKTMDDLAELTRLDMSVDIPFVLVDTMHPPCATSLDSLKKVNISDLKVETRHRGSLLVARRIGAVTQSWSRMLVALQDETGNTCMLIFTQHMRDVPADEYIPEGATLAVKDPYMHVDMVHPPHDTSDGANNLKTMFFVLRVDHPADLVVVPPCDPLVPLRFRVATSVDTGAAWKEKGNAAFARGRFLEAQRCYTEGIRLSARDSDSPTLKADLFRNRARTGLSLRFYDDAKLDALRASSLLPSTYDRSAELNTKALFRAATAAYNLSDYEGSNAILSQLRELSPKDGAAGVLDRKIKLRLREQAHGSYNFDQLRKSARTSGNTDVASFLLRTEIRPVPINGTGMFAVQDIKAGDIIFCEKAFAAAKPQDSQTKPAHCIVVGNGKLGMCEQYDLALWKNVIDKVTRNRSTSSQLGSLAGPGETLYTASPVGADDDVFLMFNRVQGNQHTITRSASGTANKQQALFVYASHSNHSCMPNTAKAFVGDLLIARASRTIKTGEQVFSSRTELCDNFEQAKKAFSQSPKGHCECAICIAEQRTSPQQRVTRYKTLKTIAAFCIAAKGINVHANKAELDSIVNRGLRLADELSATYDENSFQGVMPRRGFATLYSALLEIHMMSLMRTSRLNPKEVTKSLSFTMQAMKAQGCKVAVDPAGNVSFENLFGVENDRTIEFLYKSAHVAVKYARYKTAKQFLGHAKAMHLLEHNDNAGFPDDLAWLETMLV